MTPVRPIKSTGDLNQNTTYASDCGLLFACKQRDMEAEEQDCQKRAKSHGANV